MALFDPEKGREALQKIQSIDDYFSGRSSTPFSAEQIQDFRETRHERREKRDARKEQREVRAAGMPQTAARPKTSEAFHAPAGGRPRSRNQAVRQQVLGPELPEKDGGLPGDI